MIYLQEHFGTFGNAVTTLVGLVLTIQVTKCLWRVSVSSLLKIADEYSVKK